MHPWVVALAEKITNLTHPCVVVLTGKIFAVERSVVEVDGSHVHQLRSQFELASI